MNIPEHIQVDSMILMYIILVVILGFALYYLRKVDKDKKNTYSVMDLIVDDGKIQERKVTRLGTWVVSTWGFVYLIIEGKLDEWYFVGYIGAWVANAILAKRQQPTSKEDDGTNE
jgi:hypothetical protein